MTLCAVIILVMFMCFCGMGWFTGCACFYLKRENKKMEVTGCMHVHLNISMCGVAQQINVKKNGTDESQSRAIDYV